MRAGVAATRVTTETQVTADVLTEASIQFDNIAEDVIPDANNTRDLGSAAKKWAEGHIQSLIVGFVTSTLQPSPDDSIDLGQPGNKWRTIYVNDIQGAARALILAGL